MKTVLSLLTVITFLLAGCFETSQEITLKEDGAGYSVIPTI